MSSTIPIINLTPVPIPAPIAVITPVELEPPVVAADYSISGKTLSVTATIEIPKDVDPNSVVLFQYIDPNHLLELQFFFVYDIVGGGSGDTMEYTCPFEASHVDSSGRQIKLAKVQTVYAMMKSAHPKTSRGTVTSVRSIGGGHEGK